MKTFYKAGYFIGAGLWGLTVASELTFKMLTGAGARMTEAIKSFFIGFGDGIGNERWKKFGECLTPRGIFAFILITAIIQTGWITSLYLAREEKSANPFHYIEELADQHRQDMQRLATARAELQRKIDKERWQRVRENTSF